MKKITQTQVVKSLGARKKSPSKSGKKSPSKTLKRAYPLPKNANRMVNQLTLKRAYPLPKNANRIVNQGSLRFNKRNTNRVRNMTLYEFLRLPGVYETLMKLRRRPPRLGSLRN
jgi:hypothetical protein